MADNREERHQALRLEVYTYEGLPHLFEQPQQALNYIVNLVAGAMSTTTVPINEPLHLIAVNLYLEVVLQRNLMHYYRRAGTNYLELENHSDALRNMNGFFTPTVIITRYTHNNIVQMLTLHFFEHHLVDTTVINGPDYAEVASLEYMHTKEPREDCKVHPEGVAQPHVPATGRGYNR